MAQAAARHGVEPRSISFKGTVQTLEDLRLPDQSGLDILRQLRRIDARIPVVMVTVARS